MTFAVDVQWNDALVRELTVTIPAEAHRAGADAAGRAAAAKAGHQTGQLAADLASPKDEGPMESVVGSSAIYAGVQNSGGLITPKRSKRLLIHSGPHGSGPVVASADAVLLRGKHFMDAVPEAYQSTVISVLSARMPG